MGRKFDQRMPDMTDEELHAVDAKTLDEKSRNNLAREIAKRERKTAENDRTAAANERRKVGYGVWFRWVVALAVSATVAILVAVYW